MSCPLPGSRSAKGGGARCPLPAQRNKAGAPEYSVRGRGASGRVRFLAHFNFRSSAGKFLFAAHHRRYQSQHLRCPCFALPFWYLLFTSQTDALVSPRFSSFVHFEFGCFVHCLVSASSNKVRQRRQCNFHCL